MAFYALVEGSRKALGTMGTLLRAPCGSPKTGEQTLNCICQIPQPCSSSHLQDFKSTSGSGQNYPKFQQPAPGEGFVTISFMVLSGQPCDQRPLEASPEGGNGTGSENLNSHLHVPIPDLPPWVRTAREQQGTQLCPGALSPLDSSEEVTKLNPIFSAWLASANSAMGRGGKKPHLKCHRLQSRAFSNCLCSPALPLGRQVSSLEFCTSKGGFRRSTGPPGRDTRSLQQPPTPTPHGLPAKHKAQGLTATPLGAALAQPSSSPHMLPQQLLCYNTHLGPSKSLVPFAEALSNWRNSARWISMASF